MFTKQISVLFSVSVPDLNSTNCFLYSINGMVLITEIECLVRGIN